MVQHLLKPFGVEIQEIPPGSKLNMLAMAELCKAIDTHHLCVLRGFQAPSQDEMLSFCRQLGKIRQWQFGEIVELQVEEDSKNYLYTNRSVLFHWDGAFCTDTPHYIFLYCKTAPDEGAGGETVFCDAGLLLQRLTKTQRDLWNSISITYTPDKSVHGFHRNLIGKHPVSGKPVLRYAEPIEELNPLRLTVHGLPEQDTAAFLAEMRSLLYDSGHWYLHSWRTGDVLIADNYSLLHARRSFTGGTPRHLSKINIL